MQSQAVSLLFARVLRLDRLGILSYSPVISTPKVRELKTKRGLEMAETGVKKEANFGKKLFYISIVFLFWISWYVMRSPAGNPHNM